MVKSQMITLLAQQLKMTHKDAEAAVDAVFDSIARSLVAGRRVELRGFGSFDIKERRERTGRNPKTGASVAIEAKRVLFFKMGLALRRRVNSGAGG
jgi:integration host factor subunit beta